MSDPTARVFFPQCTVRILEKPPVIGSTYNLLPQMHCLPHNLAWLSSNIFQLVEREPTLASSMSKTHPSSDKVVETGPGLHGPLSTVGGGASKQKKASVSAELSDLREKEVASFADTLRRVEDVLPFLLTLP